MFENEITSVYSVIKLQQLCQIIGLRPIELFGEINESAASAEYLLERIREECRSRGITLEQFEDVIGWELSAGMESPKQFFERMTIDGLQCLCQELRIDWRRTLLNF
jgi:hypothetical protein